MEKVKGLPTQTQFKRNKLREILANNNIVQRIDQTIQYQRKMKIWRDIWVVANADGSASVLLTDDPPKGDVVIKIIPFEQYSVEDLLESVYGKEEIEETKDTDLLFERFMKRLKNKKE